MGVRMNDGLKEARKKKEESMDRGREGGREGGGTYHSLLLVALGGLLLGGGNGGLFFRKLSVELDWRGGGREGGGGERPILGGLGSREIWASARRARRAGYDGEGGREGGGRGLTFPGALPVSSSGGRVSSQVEGVKAEAGLRSPDFKGNPGWRGEGGREGGRGVGVGERGSGGMGVRMNDGLDDADKRVQQEEGGREGGREDVPMAGRLWGWLSTRRRGWEEGRKGGKEEEGRQNATTQGGREGGREGGHVPMAGMLWGWLSTKKAGLGICLGAQTPLYSGLSIMGANHLPERGGGREGGREGGTGGGEEGKGRILFFLEVGRYGCQNDGLDEGRKRGMTGEKKGREGGREGTYPCIRGWAWWVAPTLRSRGRPRTVGEGEGGREGGRKGKVSESLQS